VLEARAVVTRYDAAAGVRRMTPAGSHPAAGIAGGVFGHRPRVFVRRTAPDPRAQVGIPSKSKSSLSSPPIHLDEQARTVLVRTAEVMARG